MSADQIFNTALQDHQAGRLREAEAGYLRAIQLDSSDVRVWQRLGILYQQTGRTDLAIDVLRRAAELKPAAADVQSNLATVLAAAGQWDGALEAFGRAIALGANFPETHHNTGNVLRELGRPMEAIAAYREAVRLRPGYADAWHSMGALLWADRDLDGALGAFEKAVELRPKWVEALNNLGGVLQERRRAGDAVVLFRRAIDVKNEPRVWDNLLLAMHGQEGVSPREILQEHVRWNTVCAAPLMQRGKPYLNDRSSDRRLRVGYVSPDFREHPVGRLLTPVLANHDHGNFEVFCYSDVRRPDAITQGHRTCADVWVDVSSMTDDALVERVGLDRIDVLIDLTLHAANNRLIVFARKPAPVQLTWAGYPSTTGLTTIDYRLSDWLLDPPDAGRERLYTEKTLRMPNSFWCYDPRTFEPGVNELPAGRDGIVSFGCLNQFGKITDGTLARWASVMKQVPGSRLVVPGPRGSVRVELVKRMSELDVEDSRIHFVDRCPRPDYLKLYHQIDICLDSFPYPGHTTSVDALWMGVPVVSRVGETAVSRGGLSILSQVDLADLAVGSDEEFVKTAVMLANDLDRVRVLRATLRDRLMACPIADCGQFTRDIENLIRFAWESWRRR